MVFAYLHNFNYDCVVGILEINFVTRSHGCCDCLYDDISAECIVVPNCRTNRVLVKRDIVQLGPTFNFPLSTKVGGDVNLNAIWIWTDLLGNTVCVEIRL